MHNHRFFFVWGMVILGFLAVAEYRGWSMTPYSEVKNLPKSLRNNPGAYRSHYVRYFHK